MRLLLAEDERSLSRAITVLLEKNHYTVDAVYNGVDALAYLETNLYDGLILDVMMPKMDGFQVLRTIRAAGNSIPVLILSAKSEVDDKVEGLDIGANDYLTKPFAIKELLARIRAMTRNTSSQQQLDSSLSFGNISLNCSTFQLTGPGGDFTLTNKEFQILQMFMRNHGMVHSGDLLLEKVWGYDSDAEINTVWTYISYLRKKLAAIGANVEIKALRNAGYLLVEK